MSEYNLDYLYEKHVVSREIYLVKGNTNVSKGKGVYNYII